MAEETNEQLLARLRMAGSIRQSGQLIAIYDVMRHAGVGRATTDT